MEKQAAYDTLKNILPQVEEDLLKSLLKRAKGDVDKATILYHQDLLNPKYDTRSRNSTSGSHVDPSDDQPENHKRKGASLPDGYWIRGEDGLDKIWMPTDPQVEAATPKTKKKRTSSNDGDIGGISGSKSQLQGERLALWEEVHLTDADSGAPAWQHEACGLGLIFRRARRAREHGKTEGFITAWRPAPERPSCAVPKDGGPVSAAPDNALAGTTPAPTSAERGRIPNGAGAGAGEDGGPEAAGGAGGYWPGGGGDSAGGGGEGGGAGGGGGDTAGGGGECGGDSAGGGGECDGHSAGGGGGEWRLLYVDGDEEVLDHAAAAAAVRATGARCAAPAPAPASRRPSPPNHPTCQHLSKIYTPSSRRRNQRPVVPSLPFYPLISVKSCLPLPCRSPARRLCLHACSNPLPYALLPSLHPPSLFFSGSLP